MKFESQGSVSGIYNILAYKVPKQMIVGRKINGILSEHVVSYATPRPQIQTKTYQKVEGEKLNSYRKQQQTNLVPEGRKIFGPTQPVLPEKLKGQMLQETTNNCNISEEKHANKHNAPTLNNISALVRSPSDFTASFNTKRFVNDAKLLKLSEENMVPLKSYLNIEKRKKSARLIENTTQKISSGKNVTRKTQFSNVPGKEITKITTISKEVTQKVSPEKIVIQKSQCVTKHDSRVSNVTVTKSKEGCKTLFITSSNTFKQKPSGK